MGFQPRLKPTSAPTVQLSFVHAIHTAQKEIHRGVKLNIPALIMHSHQTKNPRKWGPDATQSDVILDVKDIAKFGKNERRCLCSLYSQWFTRFSPFGPASTGTSLSATIPMAGSKVT